MTQNYHTPIAIDAPANAATLRAPFEELDAALVRAIGSGTSFPVSPTEGDRFWRTDLDVLYVYTGSAWSTLLDFPQRASWFYYTNCGVSGIGLYAMTPLNRFTEQQYFGFVAYYSTANSQACTNSAMLAAGAYTISVLGETSNNCGKQRIAYRHNSDVDYTNIAYFDWYSAATTQNVIQTATFTLAKSGRFIFRFLTDGKHASSSGYQVRLTHISIRLTAGDA